MTVPEELLAELLLVELLLVEPPPDELLVEPPPVAPLVPELLVDDVVPDALVLPPLALEEPHASSVPSPRVGARQAPSQPRTARRIVHLVARTIDLLSAAVNCTPARESRRANSHTVSVLLNVGCSP